MLLSNLREVDLKGIWSRQLSIYQRRTVEGGGGGHGGGGGKFQTYHNLPKTRLSVKISTLCEILSHIGSEDTNIKLRASILCPTPAFNPWTVCW